MAGEVVYAQRIMDLEKQRDRLKLILRRCIIELEYASEKMPNDRIATRRNVIAEAKEALK